MTPYWSGGGIDLYLGDCFDIPAWLEADVLITDPPYGISYVSNSARFGSTPPIAGDGDTSARDHALRLWGDRPALAFGRWDVPRPTNVRHRLIWDKGDSPGMGDLTMPWGKSDEEVYVLGTGWRGARRSNVLRSRTMSAASRERPNHPTPKPVGLMEALIGYAPPGVIADPFAGSGSTLIAARNLGRRAIGVEIDRRYCDLIIARLGQQAFDFAALEPPPPTSSGWDAMITNEIWEGVIYGNDDTATPVD